MLGPGVALAAEEETKPPNIVLILADDHAYPYFEFMGDPTVIAPNIDRLIEGGTTFSIGYNTASVCLPSLITLLDGTEPYPRRRGWPEKQPHLDKRSLPGRLQERGYKSLQAGKFWVNDYAAEVSRPARKAPTLMAGRSKSPWGRRRAGGRPDDDGAGLRLLERSR